MLEKVCNSVTFLLQVEAWFGFVPESLVPRENQQGVEIATEPKHY
jgi:hypothetical protein